MPETILMGLAEWALRATVLAGLVGLLLLALRTKDVSLRLAAWTVVLAGALLIPLAAVVMPQLLISVPKPAKPGPSVVVVDDTTVVSSPQRLPESPVISHVTNPGPRTGASTTLLHHTPPWTIALVTLWLLVAAIMLVRLAVGLAFSRRLRRASRPIRDGVYESDKMRVPVTFGLIRPVILLPPDWRSWEEWKLQAVLAHEQAHVRNRDPLRQVAASVFRSLCWFNPLAWWLAAQLADLAEATSDDAALEVSPDRIQYAQTLLEFFERAPRRVQWEGIAMAEHGTATKRIDRILDSRRRLSGSIPRRVLLVLVAIAVPLIYAASSLRPVWAAAANSVASRPSAVIQQNLTATAQLEPEVRRVTNAASPARPLSDQSGRATEPPRLLEPTSADKTDTPSPNPAPSLQKAPSLLPAPQQLEPKNGAAWASRALPRTVSYQWSRVPGAASYGIEINCFHCCVQRQWCSDTGGATYIVRGLTEPSYAQDYVGNQPGSWRVWAIDENSNDGVASQWSEFTFSAPNDTLRLPPLPTSTAPPAKVPAFHSEAVLSDTARPPAGAHEEPARAIYSPEPSYTEAARKANISGTVALNVAVGPDGMVNNVSLQRVLTPDLDESAMSTVKTWRFEPARRDGVAVATVVYVEVSFNLSKGVPPSVKPLGDATQRTPSPPDTEAYIAPRAIYTPEPSYTEAARRARISGDVRLQVTVGADGLVHDVSVLRSLGPDLDGSAISTVKTWRFEPARRNGMVVSTTMPVEIGFYLQNR